MTEINLSIRLEDLSNVLESLFFLNSSERFWEGFSLQTNGKNILMMFCWKHQLLNQSLFTSTQQALALLVCKGCHLFWFRCEHTLTVCLTVHITRPRAVSEDKRQPPRLKRWTGYQLLCTFFPKRKQYISERFVLLSYSLYQPVYPCSALLRHLLRWRHHQGQPLDARHTQTQGRDWLPGGLTTRKPRDPPRRRSRGRSV